MSYTLTEHVYLLRLLFFYVCGMVHQYTCFFKPICASQVTFVNNTNITLATTHYGCFLPQEISRYQLCTCCAK